MLSVNQAVREYQHGANCEYGAVCRLFWKVCDLVRTHLNKIAAIAITAVLAGGLLSGCKAFDHAAASVHTLPVSARSDQPVLGTATSDPNALAIIHVRALPLYKLAQQACASKHYDQASDLLLKLARTPGLTPDETAFCLTQVDVCRKDAGLRAIPRDQGSGTRNQALSTRSTPDTQRLASSDCGPRALAIVCEQLAVPTDLAALRKAAGTTKDGTTMEGLAAAAKSVGLKTEGIQTGRGALPHLQMPAIAWTGNHYVAVLWLSGGSGDAGTARIHDPNEDHEGVISQEQLLRRSLGGYLLLVHR